MRGIAIQSDGRLSLSSNPPDGLHFVTQTSTEYQHQQNADKNRKRRNTLKFNHAEGGGCSCCSFLKHILITKITGVNQTFPTFIYSFKYTFLHDESV